VIDISKPVGQRITSLMYRDKPVIPSQQFIVATNNYRANGGGHFPGLDGSHTVLAAPDGNREILVSWLQHHPRIGANDLEPRSWTFARLKTRGPVVFTGAGGRQAAARDAGLDGIVQLRDRGDGTATYAIDLSK
jgi:2',3'-cyclic-nucleotide 2'-phosphodiesterase/3'-nucleotidase